ncbi:MAG: hypothetical protein L6437_08475 [Kiritimatiellae bacterium]|nr:hypothetical protein [Kiritimatiellia bacterium]
MNTPCQYRWPRTAPGIALALAIRPALAESPHSLSVGGRYHTENTVFTDLPYGNADISYGLAYTFAEEYVGLKLGADFSPDVSGTRDAPLTNKTDYVITPQANIVIQDQMFRGGFGILTSYIRDDKGEGDWLDLYWQMMLGLCIPLGKNLSLEGNVYYVLERWDKITEFRLKELEYGLWLNYNC